MLERSETADRALDGYFAMNMTGNISILHKPYNYMCISIVDDEERSEDEEN